MADRHLSSRVYVHSAAIRPPKCRRMSDQATTPRKGSTIQRALAPSTISLPSVAVQRSSASEHKANRTPTTGATAILNRVVSNPTTPLQMTPKTSNPPSPSGPHFNSHKASPNSAAETSEKLISNVQMSHNDGQCHESRVVPAQVKAQARMIHS